MALLSARRVSAKVGPQGPEGPPGSAGPPAPAVTATAAWTPGTVSSGSTVSLTMNVTGAVLGQTAIGAFSLAVPAGCFFVATVTALNTVRLSLVNLSGSSQTVGAGIALARALQ